MPTAIASTTNATTAARTPRKITKKHRQPSTRRAIVKKQRINDKQLEERLCDSQIFSLVSV